MQPHWTNLCRIKEWRGRQSPEHDSAKEGCVLCGGISWRQHRHPHTVFFYWRWFYIYLALLYLIITHQSYNPSASKDEMFHTRHWSPFITYIYILYFTVEMLLVKHGVLLQRRENANVNLEQWLHSVTLAALMQQLHECLVEQGSICEMPHGSGLTSYVMTKITS